jgi:hypothetical protein
MSHQQLGHDIDEVQLLQLQNTYGNNRKRLPNKFMKYLACSESIRIFTSQVASILIKPNLQRLGTRVKIVHKGASSRR